MQNTRNRGFMSYLLIFLLFAMLVSSFQSMMGGEGPDYS